MLFISVHLFAFMPLILSYPYTKKQTKARLLLVRKYFHFKFPCAACFYDEYKLSNIRPT